VAGCRAGAGRTGEPASAGGEPGFAREEPFVVRPYRPFIGSRWVGSAIAYGPYRDGQFPGGPVPTREELRQDLHLIAKRWGLLRTYGAVGPPEGLLRIIREDRLALKVMLGVWIAAEERREAGGATQSLPEARAANRAEIETAVRLAREYPETVVAICVGNETQVSWSGNRVPPGRLIDHLREVRSRTSVPVTTADDFNFWNKPESRAVAREVDFIVTHAHPLWNGLELADAVAWTRATYDSIRAAHPDREVVLGETGWATSMHPEGEQARLIHGRVGEEEQAAFYHVLRQWVDEARVPTFFFEAFDENWKGGPHPDEVEKHWGLYRADRTPKPAVADDE
jgi:exo-beta-1,3-glucanase (GH17 family)